MREMFEKITLFQMVTKASRAVRLVARPNNMVMRALYVAD